MRAEKAQEGVAGERLRPRDLEVLRWACEQYAARLDHVTALIGLSTQMSRICVRRLCRWGLVTRRRYVIGEPGWLLPTTRGLMASGVGGRGWTPSVGKLAHLAAVNDVRLHAQRRLPDAQWIPERTLRRERSEAGRAQHSHIPDGVVLVDGQRVAIEVELNHKSKRATEAVLHGHAREYDGMMCFCGRDAYGQLQRLAESGRFPKLEVRELWKLGEERPAEPAVGPRAGVKEVSEED